MFSYRRILIGLLVLLSSSQAFAEVIASNLASSTIGGSFFGSGTTTQYKAFGFTMGADAYQLDTVRLSIDFQSPNPSPVVSIWSDAAGSPGTQLFALDNPSSMSGVGLYTFTAGSLFTLEAGTTYWMHVRSAPTTAPRFLWYYTNPQTMPTGVATPQGYLFNGSTSSFYNRLEINGTKLVGTPFCEPAALNCSGLPTILRATQGTGLGSDLHLFAIQGPPNEFGYFLASQGMSDPGIATSRGFLCLVNATQPIYRYNIANTASNSLGSFGPTGTAFNNLVGTATSTGGTGFDVPNTLPTIAPGTTWNFQLWHRDSCVAPGQSNFSNGISVVMP